MGRRALVLCGLLGSCATTHFDHTDVIAAWVPEREYRSGSVYQAGEGMRVGVREVADAIVQDSDLDFSIELDAIRTRHRIDGEVTKMTATTLESIASIGRRVGARDFAVHPRFGVGLAMTSFDGERAVDEHDPFFLVVRGSVEIEIGGFVLGEATVESFWSDTNRDALRNGLMITLGGGISF